MRKGEKGILVAIAVIVVMFWGINSYRQAQDSAPDQGIPFYSDASVELQEKGAQLYKALKCRDCHALWGVRNPMQSVPTPAMDGIGSLYDEAWLFNYLSAEDPKQIVPTRLKAEYQMPSYAHVPEEDRKTLAAFLASLKVEDWYLEEVKKTEYEKLTGKTYQGGGSANE